MGDDNRFEKVEATPDQAGRDPQDRSIRSENGFGPVDQELKPLVDFLVIAGAQQIGHSNAALLDHLIGVYAILSRWGYEADVRKAGLFHSVYGTRRFVNAILDHSHREAVRGVIGERAERLAFMFGEIEPGQLFEGELHENVELDTRNGDCVTADALDRRALIAVFWANALEQLPRAADRDEKIQTLRPLLRTSASILPGAAQSELSDAHSGVGPC